MTSDSIKSFVRYESRIQECRLRSVVFEAAGIHLIHSLNRDIEGIHCFNSLERKDSSSIFGYSELEAFGSPKRIAFGILFRQSI